MEDGHTIHIISSAPQGRLIGLTALIKSIRTNTDASLKFHLVTDAEGMNQLSVWMDIAELGDIKREIIVFNRYWIDSKRVTPHRGSRWKEFLDPVRTMACFFSCC